MGPLLSFLLMACAGLLAIPVLLFCIEIAAAVAIPQRELLSSPVNSTRRRIAVLVPAHNESQGLRDTLDDIKAQLRSGDRLLVVADNCTDDTAAIAREAGAEVTERSNPGKIGKGYALDWGVRHLGDEPPEIVVIIDADCRLASDALDRLAMACAATSRPIQALNLMIAPDKSPIDYRVAMFAFRVKNWVRPLGLRALNLPCQLMGTGMAFPWEIISSTNLASGLETEDLKLGLDLARAGRPPLFCPAAGVNSQFPSSITGAKSQRKRWERGHIGTIRTAIPRLACEGLTQGNFRLLALTLDAAVPPLTLLGVLVSLMLAVSAFGVLFGLSSSALVISAASLSGYFVAVLLCWLKFGRDILPLSSISLVVSYVAGKFPLYRQILSRGNSSQWVRADRAKGGKRPNLIPE
jgi:cellulose synthase/poly-beta-1,6-N-acetylglucosamine synthase-like glycosyltransferase